jgi:hypothetical protein
MKEDPKTRQTVIRICPGDRFPLFLLCLIFAGGFGSIHYAMSLWRPNDTFERVLKFLCSELNTTLLFFTALVALRCFISTPQLEKILGATTLKVLIGMTLVGCAVMALLFLALLGQL